VVFRAFRGLVNSLYRVMSQTRILAIDGSARELRT
jgi:hypothetical protein